MCGIKFNCRWFYHKTPHLKNKIYQNIRDHKQDFHLFLRYDTDKNQRYVLSFFIFIYLFNYICCLFYALQSVKKLFDQKNMREKYIEVKIEQKWI